MIDKNIRYYMALGTMILAFIAFFLLMQISLEGLFGAIIYSLLMIIISGVFLFSILLYYEGDWLFQFLRGDKRAVIYENFYETPPTDDCIVRREKNDFYASVFMKVNTNYSTTEKTSEENFLYTQYFERALSSVRFVYKIAVMNYVKNLDSLREKIERKKMTAQIKLARSRGEPVPDMKKIDIYEREVGMWENQLSKLSTGERPRDEMVYIMVSTKGFTRDAAIAVAKANSNELKTVFENSLNIGLEHIKGDEMRLCYELAFMIPPAEARFLR